MKRLKYIIPGLALSVLAFSCQPEIDAPATSAASLDLNKYVAFGDYATAGFMNGGLTSQSQQFAYPNILAKQLMQVGAPTSFVQPVLSGEGTPTMTLEFSDGAPVIRNGEEFVKLSLLNCTGLPSLNKPYAGDADLLQNFGVPGIRITDLATPGLGNAANQNTPGFNPYFERLLPAGNNESYADVASAAKPTFFTTWFGMSDVISYVNSGGTCGTLASEAEFTNANTALLNAIFTSQPNAKGVILNLPSFDDLPVAYTPDLLKVQNDLRNQSGDNNLTIWVTSKKNIDSPTLGDTVLVAQAKDILTPKGRASLGVQGHGLSYQNPLLSDEVLDAKEVRNLSNRMNRFNVKINDIVRSQNFANKLILADMKQQFGTLRNGVIFNGVKYDLSAIKGGVFSLDNFTLTPRGQAIVANKIIQAMNQDVLPKSPQFSGFSTQIPEVDVNDYPPMTF